MIENSLLLILAMLFVITMLTMLSSKLRIPYPIFLVIAGLAISLLPGMPRIRINPELIFLIFLPPILFSAAWQIPWADFWGMRSSVATLGFGLVFFTALLIAYLSHVLIPGFDLALGFVLGGIISPPDAVAATSVLNKLKVPKSVVHLLEGESLVNDASSLIVFHFALAAVLTHTFSFWDATRSFFLVSCMGIVIGLAIAFIVSIIHKYFPTTPVIDAALTLVAPYVMYLAAENLHFSGVLAVVVGGLFLSYHAHDTLTYASRLNLAGIWNTIGFLLNGFIFVLIGLQMPYIISNFTHNTVKEALYYGLIISAAVIVIRIVWVYTITYLREKLTPKNTSHYYIPTAKEKFLIAWCGMRGVVSLAAALSIPFYLTGKTEFPYRNLILFITFVVILITLVVQGLTITPIIRLLKIEDSNSAIRRKEEEQLKLQLAQACLQYIDSNYAHELKENEPFRILRNRYSRMIEVAQSKLHGQTDGAGATAEDKKQERFQYLLLELVDIRRGELVSYRINGDFDEELIKEKEYELDLEEARLRSNTL
ncbi:Na+/H+ antiporter [Niabella ginsenosidivorans]|uniref:Na+/H+ antiporter n=1 Tax=Niabella ginsenosidivorans TaxID=1176587 RepID=A0A1A9I8G0_9BACT|nr:Na+/H+ antiporter [Niabella ginsenosidivorans]ANH82961.1 Na+/H+ antiporter [Niabella ginsenosidivorans]